MATYTPEPRGYELMVLLNPQLEPEALDEEMQRISTQVEAADGQVVNMKSTTPWGRRRLAYPIQRHQDAFYVLYSIAAQPGNLDSVERELKLNNRVLRYLLVREEKTQAVEDEDVETQAEEDAEEAESPAEEAQAEAAPAEEAPEEGGEGDESSAEADEQAQESDGEAEEERS